MDLMTMEQAGVVMDDFLFYQVRLLPLCSICSMTCCIWR